MKLLWLTIRRFLVLVVICVIGLLSPIAYIETMCRSSGQAVPYEALIAPEHHRPETRTLMTYPEWHIVHAYDDYGRVIETGDPHDFGYLRAIGGFWSSLCTLSAVSGPHGDIDGATKQMIYVIGVSFTAELLLKAAYEETSGRLIAAMRGPEKAPLDDLSAKQAQAYAEFLQQVPWYKWRFREDRADLNTMATDALRDHERRIALGLEYSVKAAYAGVIENAVAQAGQDELTLRMIVTDVDRSKLQNEDGVTVLADSPAGFEIQAPRYRTLTHLLERLALQGANFVEIASNDDIMFTVISDDAELEGAIFSRSRQGSTTTRHLVLIKVSQLGDDLRAIVENGQQLEHIHDY